MFIIKIEDVDEAEGRLIGTFLQAVLAERQRAHAKHGATSMEQAPPLDPWRGLILGEEALECGKALNDNRHEGGILLYTDGPRGDRSVGDELDKELIQTAAMAYTWWANRRGHRLPRIITDVELVSYGPDIPVGSEGEQWTFTKVGPRERDEKHKHDPDALPSTPRPSEQPNPYDVHAAKIIWDKDGPTAVDIRGFRYPVARTGTRFVQT